MSKKKTDKHVVLILPTYNEQGNMASLVAAIQREVKKIRGYVFSILVVDDYSTDGTAQEVQKLQKKYKNLFLLEGKKAGLGAAYIRGMHYAIAHHNADFLVEMDADWSHTPKLLPAFFEKIKNGADFVIGSRYIPGGSIPVNWGVHRKIFSIFGNAIARFGLWQRQVHDWTSGYRVLRAEVFQAAHQDLHKYAGYTFQIAFLHRAIQAGFTIDEVPLNFIDRHYGKSKFIPVEYIRNALLYILHNSTFLKYVIIGGIGFSVQTAAAQVLVWLQIFPGAAVGVGAFLAIVTNFLGNNLWTFSHRRIHGIRRLLTKFTHFFTTSVGALIIQIVVVSVGVFMFGPELWFVFMIGAIVFLVIPYNFFIYNRFIWKTHEK